MASTEAELLHLVDRAEAGTLLAAEAQQLRDGIRTLAASQRRTVEPTEQREQQLRDFCAQISEQAGELRRLLGPEENQ